MKLGYNKFLVLMNNVYVQSFIFVYNEYLYKELWLKRTFSLFQSVHYNRGLLYTIYKTINAIIAEGFTLASTT